MAPNYHLVIVLVGGLILLIFGFKWFFPTQFIVYLVFSLKKIINEFPNVKFCEEANENKINKDPPSIYINKLYYFFR